MASSGHQLLWEPFASWIVVYLPKQVQIIESNSEIKPHISQTAIMWASPARLLSQVTVTLFLLLVLISDQPVSSSPQPGHLVHDFYKCSSKFYYDFSRCKLEREEAARRGLNRRSRQIHHNSASTAGQEASLVVLALATLWTQKCLWWLFFGWGRVGWV